MADNRTQTKRPREEDDGADHRPIRRPRRDYTNTISILVGPEEQLFSVHKDVICVKSKFFRAACSTNWREGQEKVVRLPDVEPSTFEQYVDWAYGDVLTTSATEGSRGQRRVMVELYLLGDLLDDIRFRNETMRALNSYAIIEKMHPNEDAVDLIWSSTPPNSLLRKWIVDLTILRLSRKNFELSIANYPAEFVRDIALKLMQQTSVANTTAFQAKLPEYIEVEEDA